MKSLHHRFLILIVSLSLLLTLVALWYLAEGMAMPGVSAQTLILEGEASGGPWQSGIKVQNLGQRAGRVVLEFIDDDGKVVGDEVSADLALGASREFYLSVLPIPDGAYSVRVRSDVPVAVVTLQTNYADGIGDSYPAVGGGAEARLPFIFRRAGGWYSSVYVQNTRQRATVVELRIRSRNGTETLSVTKALPGRGRVSFDLASASFASLGDAFTGSALVTASPRVPLAVTVLQSRVTDSAHTMATLPGLHRADTGRWIALPSLYRKWRGWRSQIRLLNYSLTDPVTATIVFRSHKNSSSPGRWVRSGLTIPPGGLVDFRLVTSRLNSGRRLPKGFRGSAIVSATGPLQVAVIHTRRIGDVAMSQRGIPLRHATAQLGFPSLYNNFGQGPWRSRIRLHNTDPNQSIRVKFTFRADDDLPLQGSWTKSNVIIPPRQSYDFFLSATPVDGGQTLPDEFRGSATVEVTSGPAKLVGAATNFNRMRRVATMYDAIKY